MMFVGWRGGSVGWTQAMPTEAQDSLPSTTPSLLGETLSRELE